MWLYLSFLDYVIFKQDAEILGFYVLQAVHSVTF